MAKYSKSEKISVCHHEIHTKMIYSIYTFNYLWNKGLLVMFGAANPRKNIKGIIYLSENHVWRQ